jgi:hypothetical protein
LTAHGLTTHLTDSRAGLDLTATLSPSGKREAEIIIDLCRPRGYAEGRVMGVLPVRVAGWFGLA